MTTHEGEIVALSEEGSPPFEAIQRGYKLEVKTPRPGETVFTALGEYAIHQLRDEEPWQLLPAHQWPESEHFQNSRYSRQWATAEDLRTWAGEGIFSPAHMDLIDATLFREQRVTNEATKLTIATEADLRTLLARHTMPTDRWSASIHRLYTDIKPSRPSEETENIALHLIDGTLWLSTAQTMVNVYYNGRDGETYKLQETDVTSFDDQGDPQPSVKSKLRSSLGETGHITGHRPERPFVTARRGLREELSLNDDDIAKLVSLGSLLRLKEAGHHNFSPIKAEDRTHYFRAELKPQAIRPEYINKEYDTNGKLRAQIKLEWFVQDSA